MISIIILYDQISRHICRIKKYDIIDDLNKRIVEYIKHNYAKFDNVNVYEYCFVMLPLRHTKDFNNIKFVLSESWNKLIKLNTESDKQQMKRFLKATYENIIKQITEVEFVDYQVSEIININQISEKYKDILDELVFKNNITSLIENRTC